MKRPSAHRVRWRKRESGRFAILALVEAVNPSALSKRNRNELERLDRARQARWYSVRSREEKRQLRRKKKHTARLLGEFKSALARFERDNLTLTHHHPHDMVPIT